MPFSSREPTHRIKAISWGSPVRARNHPALGGAAGSQQALQGDRGDDPGQRRPGLVAAAPGIEGEKTRGHHDAAHPQVVLGFLRGRKVDGPQGTGRDALAATGAVLPVHHVPPREGRGGRQVNGGPPAQPLLQFIGNLHRANLGAPAAAVASLAHRGERLPHRNLKVAEMAAHRGYFATREHPDAGMQGRRGHHGINEAQSALSLGKGVVPPVGHTPQHRLALHQGHGEAGVGDVQGGPEPGGAAADHQGLPMQGHPAVLEGAGAPHLGQPHANEVQGLGRRRLGLSRVHPGAVLPQVDDLQQIRVNAAFLKQPPEGGLVELGRAGGQHHPVQGKVLDILLYFFLAGLGAGIEVMAANQDPGQILGCRGQGFRIQDPGDVEAAVANIEADACHLR